MRNLLARVPKGSAEMVAATMRTIFAQPTAVREQLDKVAGVLGRQFPASPPSSVCCATRRPHALTCWLT